MKIKMLGFLLTLTITSTLAVAQKIPFFQAGIKAGTNITKIDGKSFKEEFMFGYNLGAFAAIKIGEKWQIQPEILFNQYNSRTASNFDTLYKPDNLKDISLNYLSIPVLLNYSPSKIVTFQAGPQFGKLLNKDENLVQEGRNAFKDGDLSLLGGIQINIANFKIGGRYFIGLNDISDIDKSEKWKNQGFQLSVGLRIL